MIIWTSQNQMISKIHFPLSLSRMNRRNFIKKSSLTAAGGIIFSQIPLHAAFDIEQNMSKHVVLCIVAGLAQEDFTKLFSTERNSVLHKGFIIENMQYSGKAAGHRLALESILHGKYLQENEVGKSSLIESPLFRLSDDDSKKYLITSDRHFLREGDKQNKLTHHKVIGERDIYRNLKQVYSEDLHIAEAAAEICKEENPSVLVTHFMGADEAHGNYSLAQNNIQHIGNGIQYLWESVEANPQMKGNTLFIVMSDFGRNDFNNTIQDEFGKLGSDHSIMNESTRKTSCLIVPGSIQLEAKFNPKNITAESTDIAFSIQEYLGYANSEKFAGKNLLRQA